jgi:hypothetical protein
MAKIGKEVEGKFLGLLSIFISNTEYFEMVKNYSFKLLSEKYPDLKQIYISDLSNDIDLYDDVLRELSQYYIITVECTKILAESVPEHVNIVLNIEPTDFWKLNLANQIKFSKNNYVYMVPVMNMSLTTPDKFLEDIEIEL